MTKEKQNAETMISRYETLQSLVMRANVLREMMHGKKIEILRRIRPSQNPTFLGRREEKQQRAPVLYVQSRKKRIACIFPAEAYPLQVAVAQLNKWKNARTSEKTVEQQTRLQAPRGATNPPTGGRATAYRHSSAPTDTVVAREDGRRW